MSKENLEKIYIAVEYSYSYEGGDCLNCMYSGLDKYEVCEKCIRHAIKELETSFMEVDNLYTEYKIISISDPKAFTSDCMIKEAEIADTVAEVMGLDQSIYEEIKQREHTGYYVDVSDPKDISLRKQIIDYLKKAKRKGASND